MIVDSQVHLWGENTPERPWRRDAVRTAHRAVPPTADDLLREMDGAGVDRAVLVPPSWEGDRNDLALKAAADHPDRFAVMGRFPAHDPAMELTRWLEPPGMLGIRLTLHREPWLGWHRAGRMTWFWRSAERLGIPVAVYAPGLLPDMHAIAAAHPDLRLVLDHLALPLGRVDQAAFAGLDELLALARLPNVAVKASALPCHTSEPYPFPGLHDPIRQVLGAFGPERMFFGSDLTRLPCPYVQAVELFTETLGFLGDADREWVMGRGLREWLDWCPE